MIGLLRGQLVSKKPPTLLLEVAGVGYELEVPMSTFFELPEIGETMMLHTHLAVREDAHHLYGFLTEAEKSLFRTLIRVNGVGSKLALGILSSLSVESFRACVENREIQNLTRLPGIGKKTAERLIVELKDRFEADPEGTRPSPQGAGASQISPQEEAISALVALGFKLQDAQSLIRPIDTEGKGCEEIIRLALKGVSA